MQLPYRDSEASAPAEFPPEQPEADLAVDEDEYGADELAEEDEDAGNAGPSLRNGDAAADKDSEMQGVENGDGEGEGEDAGEGEGEGDGEGEGGGENEDEMSDDGSVDIEGESDEEIEDEEGEAGVGGGDEMDVDTDKPADPTKSNEVVVH